MEANATAATPLQEIVIQGLTESGRPFRPSDWSDRLCGMMSVFSEDRHLSYSPYLKPVVAAGLSCVVVDRKLESLDPAAFQFLMEFARDNELRMRPGRNQEASVLEPGATERRAADAQPSAAT